MNAIILSGILLLSAITGVIIAIIPLTKTKEKETAKCLIALDMIIVLHFIFFAIMHFGIINDVKKVKDSQVIEEKSIDYNREMQGSLQDSKDTLHIDKTYF